MCLFHIVKAQISTSGIYKIKNGDSTLAPTFIKALCKAAREKTGADNPGTPSTLESLVIMAAGTGYLDEDQPEKSMRWHSKFGSQCQCEATEEFPAGDFLRQVVHSNYRDFANLVGPNNRLSLDLSLKGPNDDLTIFDYINQIRIDIEASHDNRRFEFQQDEAWRNIMFFYFLFSEYRVN
ncbi:hypothetical protein C900_02702 [Fulvivirga imtechensis AK7]|uniref:Uncharacterized protein n=1 Tax=Fulvivirga imtechensis AK7 TaxID=1237149 RepID=L8K2D8_9BACT|nr:hypothetical protein [Fulvivirga imtechensis]ELR73617.1 hypothetical protein C900_02702 [Fulvivirga imtechensis AK7]